MPSGVVYILYSIGPRKESREILQERGGQHDERPSIMIKKD